LEKVRIGDYLKLNASDFQNIVEEELKISFLPALLDRLVYVSETYLALGSALEKEIKASDIRLELVSLKKHTEKIVKLWQNMNPQTYFQLGRILESPYKTRMTLIDLSMCIEDAISELEIKPGPDMNDVYKNYLIDLSKIYKEATGKQPTSGHVDLQTGELKGQFPRFVYKCLKVIGLPPQSAESLRQNIKNLKLQNRLTD